MKIDANENKKKNQVHAFRNNFLVYDLLNGLLLFSRCIFFYGISCEITAREAKPLCVDFN